MLLLKARRPSKIADMPSVYDAFWLRRGYSALTFFGTIVTATRQLADEMDQGTSELKTHEMIHLRQAQNTHDSWVCFYLLYLWHYLRALPMNRRVSNAAYLLNPFELEAYTHEASADYLDNPACGSGWRCFAKMKPSERSVFLRSVYHR